MLLLILLLVIMFTGLGLIAMRHTQAELYAAGAYLDNVQARSLAETAIAMLVTDLKDNHARRCDDNKSYISLFYENTGGQEAVIDPRFSPVFQTNDPEGSECKNEAGVIPDPQLRGDDPDDGESLYKTVSALSYSVANVNVFIDGRPVEASPPAGFSNDRQNDTMGWYFFNLRSTARFGAPTNNSVYATDGSAVVRARVKIGPMQKIYQQAEALPPEE